MEYRREVREREGGDVHLIYGHNSYTQIVLHMLSFFQMTDAGGSDWEDGIRVI